MNQSLLLQTKGWVKIVDRDTGAVILDRANAVHPQNMSLAIARSLAHEDNGYVYEICFGNGGTSINSSSVLVYRTPNTLGAADLYNQTYSVQVDDQVVGTPTTNSTVAASAPNPSTSAIVTVIAMLNSNEPSDQAAADNITTDTEAPYVFDELGLKTSDGLLLTHVIFSPIEKTANRAFLITYTITVSVS